MTKRVKIRAASLLACTATMGTVVWIAYPTQALAATSTGWMVYTANYSNPPVTAINSKDNSVTSISAGSNPYGIAITPDGKTVYITNYLAGTITPINLSTGKAGTDITEGTTPLSIAISPNGDTAYVVDQGEESIVPINLTNGTSESSITVGDGDANVADIAITPDGTKGYVAYWNNKQDTAEVTVLNLSNNTVEATIDLGSYGNFGHPCAIAITPDGKTAYVVDNTGYALVPINIADNSVGTPISLPAPPTAIAVSPDGKTAYVAEDGGSDPGAVQAINLSTGSTVWTATVGVEPAGIALTPDGKTAFVTNYNDNTVSAIDVASGTVDPTILVGDEPYGIVVEPDQAPVATFRDTVTPGDTVTFDASASTDATSPIQSYQWNFGDGLSTTTTTPTVSHTYANTGLYTVTLTETDAAGTSTTQVYTGHVVSQNGGPSAQYSHSVQIPCRLRWRTEQCLRP